MTRTLLVAPWNGSEASPDWCMGWDDRGPSQPCTVVDDGELDPMLPGTEESVVGGFGVVMVVALLAGLAGTAWKVSTARRMARSAGMHEGDATAMALLADGGLEATYLASSLQTRPTPHPGTTATPAGRSSAERLRELQELAAAGLITAEEHEERRRAVLDDL